MNTANDMAMTVHSLTGWDYAIIAFYGLLIATIGPVCLRLNKSSSDYFRGGGNMLWWIGAISTLAVSISTWSFTGGAAKSYLDGFIFPVSQMLALIPATIVLFFLAPRFRRMRVITAMEAVFRRFGLGTEQFYTWFTLPMGLFWGAIGLNTLAVVMSSVFRMDLALTIIAVGALVTLLATTGGQWAVSFFGVVQGTILFLIVVVVLIFSLWRPEIGGVANLAHVLPPRHMDFDLEASGTLIWMWIIWQIIFGVMLQIEMRNAGKYVRVKDDASVRKMVLMMAVPGLILGLPFLIQLPSMCAAVLYPDLSVVFPQLKSPEEGAWLAMALTVLPQGLVGLMVCAMFGAASDSLDAALNSNAGFFVRNVYIRYINRSASEMRQIFVGKATTATFGVAMVAMALMVNSLRTLNLFDLFQTLNALLLPPMIVPMVLGMFVKRTPNWSGWSSVLAGLIAGLAARSVFDSRLLADLLGLMREPNAREMSDGGFIFVSTATFLASSIWFCVTRIFWGHARESDHQRIESLFTDMARPVDHLGEGGENQDGMQYRITGVLSMVMGGFLLACALIPNPPTGRVTFLCIGAILFTMGFAFFRTYQRLSRTKPKPETPDARG